MSGLIRIISRVGIGLVVTMTVAFSASCGCGGGSSGPTIPGSGYYSGGYYSAPHHYNYSDYWHHRDSNIEIRPEERYPADLLETRWLAGAGYLEEADHSRVERGGVAGDERWDWLAFLPATGADGMPSDPGVASAIYCIGTAEFGQGEVYLELNWVTPPEPDGACWIGLYRPDATGDNWNWFQPDETMRIALSPLAQYQNSTCDLSIYIAVVVTGDAASVLRQVRLCEYRSRW